MVENFAAAFLSGIGTMLIGGMVKMVRTRMAVLDKSIKDLDDKWDRKNDDLDKKMDVVFNRLARIEGRMQRR